MKIELRTLMSSSAIAAALLLTSPAFAQVENSDGAVAEEQSQDEDAKRFGTVIVTAQRREERLQDVPIAISAIGDTDLKKSAVVDLEDLRASVPGLSISGFAGANASNIISIRGITGQSLAIGSGQAVAVYLDGVYLSRPDSAFFGLDDVERLEVLRGPQGTLYGRNATAGAINIVTRDPGDDVAGGFDVSYGNFNTISAKGSISGPFGGGFSGGLSGSYLSRDGYIKNLVTGNDLNARETYTVRGKLRYDSDDGRFNATLAADYTDDDATPTLKNGMAFPTPVYVGPGDFETISIDAPSDALTNRTTKNQGLALTMNYEFNDYLDLVSITSTRSIDIDQVYDAEQSALPLLVAGITNMSDTFSQEFRGLFTFDNFRATVGFNYFNEQAEFGIGVYSPTATPFTNNPYDTTELDAWAVFSQLEYDLNDQWTIVGGLRYNNESRDLVIDYSNAPTGGPILSDSLEDEVLIPSVGVNFKATPDVLLYAKASQGYQAPGFNFLPGATATQADLFDAETLWAYEVGAKTQFADGRVTLNGAAFLYDYTDIQIRSTVGVGLTRVDNAATATLQGFEASLDWFLGGGFDFGAHVTYLDATYDEFCQPISAGDPQANDPLCSPGLADRSGNRLGLAPEWSGGMQLGYETEVADAGTFSANLNYTFSDEMYFLGASNEPETLGSGFEDVGARAAFEFNNGAEAYVFGRNLTDDRTRTLTGRVNAVSLSQSFNAPRTFGIGLSYRY